MKLTPKETQNEWLVSSPVGNKILANMEIVSNSCYVCIKIMLLCKTQEYIWKWVVFLLFVIIYHNLPETYYETGSSLSIISGINISQKVMLQEYLLSSCRFIRDKNIPYFSIYRKTIFWLTVKPYILYQAKSFQNVLYLYKWQIEWLNI